MEAPTLLAFGWPAVGALMLRIAARRPASWLAAGMACGAAWAFGPFEAMAVAALAMQAAAGDLPPAGVPPAPAAWIASRIAWPLAGLVGGVGLRLIADPLAAFVMLPAAGAAGLAMLATAVAAWAVRQRGEVTAADAVSLAMLTATASLTGGIAADSWLVAIVLWAVLGAIAAWLVHRIEQFSAAPLPRSGGDLVAGLMFQTPLRRVLGRAAMVTMLAAMVGWLLLDPDQASRAAALAATLVICLALPLVAFQDGSGDAAACSWAALLASTPVRQLAMRDTSTQLAAETVVRHAAILGWPSLVAAAVAAGSPAGPWPAILVVAVIAAAGGTVLAVTLICRRLGLARETIFAVAAAIVAGFLLLPPGACGDDVAAFRPKLPDFMAR